MRGSVVPASIVLVACAACSSRQPARDEVPQPAPTNALEPAPVRVESTAIESKSDSSALDSTAKRPPKRLPPPIGSVWPPALAPPNTAPPDEKSCAADTIAASHILVAWGGAMRASAQEPVKSRTKEQALARAREALQKARSGVAFAALVGEYSDEPQAKAREGKLGRFGRGRMVKAFEDAAFALCPGELSDVVETPFGYHIVLRTE
jgi:hypothetical protein